MTTKKCPECDSLFTGKKCRCGWEPEIDFDKFVNCYTCGEKATKHRIHGHQFCYEHLQDEFAKDYVCTQTAEQLSRFLSDNNWISRYIKQRITMDENGNIGG